MVVHKSFISLATKLPQGVLPDNFTVIFIPIDEESELFLKKDVSWHKTVEYVSTPSS
jgi:hypothetical protein